MNPPERFPPDDPREWMNRARSNLLSAKNRIPGVYLEDLCFDAQQAAEKAIKAVMIRRTIDFPYVHDLTRLLSLLEEAGETIPEAIRKAEALTPYAWITRYPGADRPVSEQEYAEADRERRSSCPMGRGAPVSLTWTGYVRTVRKRKAQLSWRHLCPSNVIR